MLRCNHNMKTFYIEVNSEGDFGGDLDNGRCERYATLAKSKKGAIKKVKEYLLEHTCLGDCTDNFDDYVNIDQIDSPYYTIE